MIDYNLLAQAQGFVKRFLELDQEAGVRGSEKALEYFEVIEQALIEQRMEVKNLNQKLSSVRIAMQ